MGWLRREKDCIALVVAAALALQAIVVSIASGAHAGALASGGSIVLCTAKGAVAQQQLPGKDPGKDHRSADCGCCSLACRVACGGSCGGILPVALDVLQPRSALKLATGLRVEGPRAKPAWAFSAQPRAPPFLA
ncbi:MAG: DUF2946 domain-containing protein [Methyloceanibacter sp.]